MITGDVTSVTPTSATLRGAVTPNGLSTTWWFEYGTSTRYGSKTSNQSAGSGSSARAVAAGVKSLRPRRPITTGSSPRTRAVAVSARDRTFSTVGAPAAQTGAAQSVGPSGAVVTGSLDTRGRPTTWWFEFGTTSSYGTKTAAKSAAATAGAQTRKRAADRAVSGDDLPLSARREERRRHHSRRRRDLHDRRRDAHRRRARGRLRRSHPPLRSRPDRPGRRAGRGLRAGVQRRILPLDRDGARRL